MDHSFSVTWFLKNNYSCARPSSWLSGKTWVSRKVLITDTHCRCVLRETGHLPIHNSTGSDAQYNSGTVYPILKKLCRLTFFLFANRVAIRGLIRFYVRSKISLRLSIFWMPHDLVRVSIWNSLSSLCANVSLGAGENDDLIPRDNPHSSRIYEDLPHTFWCTSGDCSWLVGWQN
jgi:hypothetical protein